MSEQVNKTQWRVEGGWLQVMGEEYLPGDLEVEGQGTVRAEDDRGE